MSIERPSKTPTDYMVIAVSPALIIVMVHSLCFFLVDIFYRGEAVGGVRWVLFWFVLAVVLIARIGIEQSAGHAVGYGLTLAGATWMYLSTVQPNVVFGAVLLGIVWLTAHKLTCNCTLIDEDDDASGQGLLQSLWRLSQRFEKVAPPKIIDVPRTRAASLTVPAVKKAKPANSQPPGIWLIYYSLLALPIFGLGQTLLPAADLAARHRGFIYLFLYLTAALGLLVTTSFLGLRRYLRQRYLVMPGNIVLGWVQCGVVAALLVLGATLLLPRPGGGDAWVSLRYQVDYQISRASKFAARFNPHGKGSGRAGDQSTANGQEPNAAAQSDQASPEKPTGDKSGDQAGNGSKSGTTDEDGQGHPPQPIPELSGSASAIYPWLRALFWLAVMVGVGWLFFRYRVVIWMALQNAWAAIRGFFEKLFGSVGPAGRPVISRTIGVPPFQKFKNPFLTGGDRTWPPEKLIVYSYDALQSWMLEQKAEKGSPQTPRELCRQAGVKLPEAAPAFEQLAFLYGHVAYGATVPANYDPENLRRLWDWLATPRTAGATAEGQIIFAGERWQFPPMPLTFTSWLPSLFQFPKPKTHNLNFLKIMFYPMMGSIGSSNNYTAMTASEAERDARSASTSVEFTRHDIERLLLVTEALWTFMKQEHGYTDDALTKMVTDIETKRGGTNAAPVKDSPVACPACGRVNTASRQFCIFCGKQMAGNPFAR